MRKDIADKWAAALRSGKYKQGTGALRQQDDSYCCLGVLCDLLIPDEWSTNEGGHFRILEREGELPETVVREAGMLDDIGNFSPIIGFPHLAVLNDRGTSFADIADLIEKHWEDL